MNKPAAVLALALSSLAACHDAPPVAGEDVAEVAQVEGVELVASSSGAESFARHCAVCHGAHGRADGPGAPFLFPPPRDFSRGLFHWVSTTTAMPSKEDLLHTLRRGVPGSAMPSWGWLGELELDRLADHVLALARDGLAQAIAEESDDVQVPMGWEEALKRAREVFEPGPSLPPVEEPQVTEALLAEGRRVYLQACAMCHGEEGRGQPEPAWNPDGTPNWARDFTAGFLGSGGDFQSIANRVRAGIPGTAMLPTAMRDEELQALVAYVRSLIPPGTDERLVHHRGRVVAHHVRALPESSSDDAWRAAAPLRVVLAPLRWREEAVLVATLRALHDGDTLALRVEWDDDTADVGLFSDVHKPDGFALQLSAADRPALFGMGARSEPTTIWHWQSVRLEDVAGALDLMRPAPHLPTEVAVGDVKADTPLYRPLLATPPVSERVDSFQPQGVDRASSAHRHQESGLEVAASHDGTRWSVTFRRPLAVAGELSLTPGSVVQVACAAWDGSVGNHGADKSISIWQELLLDR